MLGLRQLESTSFFALPIAEYLLVRQKRKYLLRWRVAPHLRQISKEVY
jgi:hypothetical protein